ncbi:sensor histidine kinase [Hymenobacter convexus]|uniref:sensor histidine kinase n=1 Tax=Hymenobacter sp. CA1UV-4 TaxID=3063782 RepID=UPI00271293A4|nr:ATP-binding protein [Hymenobacter sp. CA1UV-4]MDO7851685.1 histidine kinase [Hymenobacter sp. CA1UV-4]
MASPEEVTFGPLLFWSIGMMLLAAGCLLLFLVTYQKRLLLQELQLRMAESVHQQQLLAAVIEAQEGERERIGQDLHDGIGSTIATAKLLVNRLSNRPAPENAPELLAMVEELMAAAVQDARSISHSLYPAVLARFGLAEAIQHLVDVCNETETMAIELELDYTHPLALAKELALYRICQELMHNALKHARGATQLLVSLQQQHQHLTLEVADNGCGFSLGPAPAGSGAGLRNIDVRVQMLGARLHQESAPGRGSRFIIQLKAPA